MRDTTAAHQHLVELFLSLFSQEELRRFVHVKFPRLARELSDGTSPYGQAELIVESLARHGELDDELFAGLRTERPKRAADVDNIAALFPSRRAGAPPHADATQFDVAIEDLEGRIAALVQDGLDAGPQKAELLQLRAQRRAYPAPARGLCLAGRYTLDIELGQGGFASVWRASDRTEHRRVAIKLLHSHHASDRIRLDRFARGMRTMGSLDHPNILRVHEPLLVANGFTFAVLELVSGGDIEQAVLHRRLPPDQIWAVLLALCDALSIVHARGLVHRDIKPSNILVTETGTPLLTDFDLVLDHETIGGTRTGALGSVLYTAPELWGDAHSATPAADVYSLAMTAVFAYRGTHLSPNVLRDLDAELDDLDLTPPLRDVLRRALAWNAADRYVNANVLADAIKGALERPTTTINTAIDPLAGHDILYWIADDRGLAETVWLSENAGRLSVTARAPGIVLAAGPRLWRLSREIRQIAGCDLTTVNPDRYKIVAIDVDVAELIEVGDTQRVPLGLFTEPSDTNIRVGTELDDPHAGDSGLDHFDHSVSLTFAAGPYVFIRSTSYALSHYAAHGSANVGFEVIDLRTGQQCEVLSPEERTGIAQELGATANAQLDQEHGEVERPDFIGMTPEPSTPQLTMLYAHYGTNGELQLSYQFTRETYYAGSDNLWDDYTCSTRLPAPRLPASLQDLAIAPRLLQQYWQGSPYHAGSHGWTAAPRTLDTRRRLRQCFAELTRPQAPE